MALAAKGPHYAWIKAQAPGWLTQASLHRLHSLNDLLARRPAWYASASAYQHQTLKQLNAEAWRLQNALDAKLGPVQDVYAFAEPLLKRAIKDQYNLDLDVKATFLHIYTPKQLPWYALELSKGVTSRSVSLLDAALHNFASGERFEQYSCYISKPDYRGHFQILRHDRHMSLEQFKALCRELDLGSLYQRHLDDYLAPTEPVAQAVLKPQVIASQKAALKAAAFMALAKEELGAGAYAVITGVLDGTEKRAHFYQLDLLDTPLSGIVLIARNLDQVSSVSKLIAYIPHDPETPVKEYDSSTAFIQDLTRKLQLNRPLPSSKEVPPTTYQQFFSQFVPHARRGVFFAELTERLYRVQWHERDTQDPAPAWCEEAVNTPKLQFKGLPIVGELWEQLYQSALNKILNDGRSLAVSTAEADDNQRWAWWENVLKIGADLLNAALLVVTPFVPLLGELMLAYTAYQLANEVFESIVDFSEGQALEATQHVIAVVTDVLQLSAMAGGGILAKELLFKPSPFVNRLKPVQVGDKTRLWNPDLSPYARSDLQLPAQARPDKAGLYDHQGQKVVRLNDQQFVVEEDTERNAHRVKHPTRPAAYAPTIEANGSGAWVHEGEDPWTWDDAQLRNRLGHATDGLSADEVANACDISDTQPGALRKMYLNLEPTPPLLEDSLSRLRLADEARMLPEQVRSGAPTADWFTWAAQITTERRGWPADKAIRVFNNAELTGDHLTFGSARGDAQTLDISHQDVGAGQLAQRLHDVLSPAQLEALLPEPLPDTAEARIQALRDQMADDLERNRIATFNHLYSGRQVLDSAHGRLLQQEFPQLPAKLVQRLMLRTSPREVLAMTEEQHIPLRVKNLAWELQNEAIASHAFEGFYNDDLLSADTERLALNTLRLHSDALGELRITVRDQLPDGDLRSQAGPSDAAEKTLLRLDNGRYTIDPPGGADYDFFEALLRALPEGKTDYVPGQGRLFKGWLKDQLLSSGARREVLEPAALRQVDKRETQTLLQKPMFGALRSLLGGNATTPQALETRMRRLCPLLTDAQAQSVLLELQTEPGQRLLSQLESEKKVLEQHLDAWRKKPLFDRENEPYYRRYISDQLRSNWESTCPGRISESAANPESSSLDLSFSVLTLYIRSLELPPGFFDHITELDLSTTRPLHRDLEFLKNFPNVRELNLSENELDGVPTQLRSLRHLTNLDLSANPGIRWDAVDIKDLYACSMLESLNLQGNTELRAQLNLNRLPRLRRLNLRRTSVDQWPSGLNTPRDSLMEMDLLDTAINTVPEYPDDAPATRIIANSWLDRTTLEPEAQQRFSRYRLANGIDPERTLPASDPQDRAFWVRGRPLNERSEAETIWNELEAAPDSEGFFRILKMLRPPEEFHDAAERARFEQGRKDLIGRAWELMIALHGDAELRDRLFHEASAPTNCADASATIFNSMGVEVLKKKILTDTSPQGLAARTRELVKLALQKWRLDEVGKIARSEIAHRTDPVSEGGLGQTFGSNPGQVDEVEVYLAFQTGLKQRLDLPWVSEHMVYRHLSGVTDAQLDTAFELISSKASGNTLLDGLLDQGFWNDLVEQDPAVTRAREQFQTAFSLLHDDLQPKQLEWSTTTSLERKAQLETELITLLAELNRPDGAKLGIEANQILTETPLPETTLNGFYQLAQLPYRELKRTFTQNALNSIEG